MIQSGAFDRRQKYGVAAYRRIEEHQTSAIPLCFFRKLESELSKLTEKRGSLTKKLKSVLAKIQIFV